MRRVRSARCCLSASFEGESVELDIAFYGPRWSGRPSAAAHLKTRYITRLGSFQSPLVSCEPAQHAL